MAGLNRVQLIGNLGRDPELRYTQNGTPVANFSLAVNERYGDQERTEWFRIVCWRKLGELVAEHLEKGRQVYVEGNFRSRQYTDRDGVERDSMEVHANDVIFLGSGPGGRRAGRSGYGEHVSDEQVGREGDDDGGISDDDIPF